MTESLDVCAGGQMGKMFIVQGCYADGPKILPECVEGAEARSLRLHSPRRMLRRTASS